MSSYPIEIPLEITAGNNVEFCMRAYDTVHTELTSGSSYSLVWVISNASNQYSATTQVQNSQGFFFQIPYSTTSGWTAGDYSTEIYADDGTNRYPQTKAFIKIKPELDIAVDGRSDYRQIKDALNAAILGQATSGQLAMSIAGRSVQKMGLDELISALNYFDSLVASEDRVQDFKDGKPSSNTISTRFVR